MKHLRIFALLIPARLIVATICRAVLFIFAGTKHLADAVFIAIGDELGVEREEEAQ